MPNSTCVTPGCGATLFATRRPKMWCDEHHPRRKRPRVPKAQPVKVEPKGPRICDVEGCERKHRSRGLCQSHYNRKYQPNRHGKVIKTCDYCGSECVKERRAQRYTNTFCTERCRDRFRTGIGEHSVLPDNHWARHYGATCAWVPPKEPQARYRSGRCEECGTAFVELACYTASKYCSNRCAKRLSKRNRRAREHGASGEFRYIEVLRQYTKQGGVCAYCEQPAAGLPDPEHVLALSRGGRNDMSNLVAACRGCNTDKGDLTLNEWSLSRAARNLQPLANAHLVGPAYMHVMHEAPTVAAHRHRPAA